MYINILVFLKKKTKKTKKKKKDILVEMEKPFLFEQEQLEKIFCFYK